MSDRKRVTASSHAGNNNSTPAATLATAKVRGRPPLPQSPTSNKKRRVTFCKTTKLPPNMKQPPLIKTDTVLLINDPPSLSPSFLVSESSTDELDLNVSPVTLINKIMLRCKITAGSMALSGEDIMSDASQRVQQPSYYLTYKEEHLEAYTTDKVKAVQGNDVATLRSLHESGHVMQASNRFGESVLHMSCRRGFTDTFEFFLNEARVSPRVRDDMGRTPMHDVCWSSAAPNHDIMEMLIREAPEMLLSKDKRGHSPFDYARREHWPNWVSFLNDNRQLIINSMVSSFLASGDHACTKEIC